MLANDDEDDDDGNLAVFSLPVSRNERCLVALTFTKPRCKQVNKNKNSNLRKERNAFDTRFLLHFVNRDFDNFRQRKQNEDYGKTKNVNNCYWVVEKVVL